MVNDVIFAVAAVSGTNAAGAAVTGLGAGAGGAGVTTTGAGTAGVGATTATTGAADGACDTVGAADIVGVADGLAVDVVGLSVPSSPVGMAEGATEGNEVV